MVNNMKDIFLSHTSFDKDTYVRPFAEELEYNGISYWLDEAEIRWGEKITTKINVGLKESKFVVVFLSKDFVGRNWPESELAAALNRENSEGRVVVLPIIIGEPNEILENYPLLRDKAYIKWDEGIVEIVEKLQTVLFISATKPSIKLQLSRSSHTVEIKPDLVMKFLSELDSHSVYDPRYICKGLIKCGLLADVKTDNRRIEVNGAVIKPVKPHFGKAGINPYDVATLIFKLLTGDEYMTIKFGRGTAYRELLKELRVILRLRVELGTEPNNSFNPTTI